VMLASYFGLPISTTTTLVGSVTGVGLIRSIGEGENSTIGTDKLSFSLYVNSSNSYMNRYLVAYL